MKNEDSEVELQRKQRLSALVDGELGVAELSQVLEDWRVEPSARECWHDYQLIGDVLRSDDLATPAARDAAFLAALRTRLATEPVVLAPEPLPFDNAETAASSARSRRRLVSLGAVAAGFMIVVAGALTLTGLPLSGANPGDAIAVTAPAAAPTQAAETALASADRSVDPANPLEPTVASGQLIRDARLDRYFSAHQQWSGNAMLGGHAAYLRSGSNDQAPR